MNAPRLAVNVRPTDPSISGCRKLIATLVRGAATNSFNCLKPESTHHRDIAPNGKENASGKRTNNHLNSDSTFDMAFIVPPRPFPPSPKARRTFNVGVVDRSRVLRSSGSFKLYDGTASQGGQAEGATV